MIPVFQAGDPTQEKALLEAVRLSLATSESAPEPEPIQPIIVPEFGELIGIDPSVYRQVNAALAAGKRHLLLYGPPGTGKTTLAQLIGASLSEDAVTITASADWTSQDLIGGYQPIGGGRIRFVPGAILANFTSAIVIDELNRCDIDKAIGPLFTVLSGQPTVLPYSLDPADPASARIEILPTPTGEASESRFAPGEGWRLIATINSADKASLYQMSYALSRRFAWIAVEAPVNLGAFVRDWLGREGHEEEIDDYAETPLVRVWEATNAIRPLGAAPFIDLARSILRAIPDAKFGPAPQGATQVAFLDGFAVFVLPLLDSIRHDQAEALLDVVFAAVGLDPQSVEARKLRILADGFAA